MIPLPTHIKAICFDAFGTLVEIADKRRPYQHLLEILDGPTRLSLKDRLMREPLSLEDCLKAHSDQIPLSSATKLRDELRSELKSVHLRKNTTEILRELRGQGYLLGLCSNLAASYGQQLLNTLSVKPEAIILSYEHGFIKPEPEIYALVANQLRLKPEEILFTGDTQKADIDGPQKFGMAAMHIDDFENSFNIV